MTAVTVRVPAKVNVQLAVGGRRSDGFHDLANVFLAVGLYDHVTATSADELRITAEGRDVGSVPLDASNLAARAAVALAERHGIAPAVHLHIAKDIPVAGGMAGGSADGAAALLACDTLWGLHTPLPEAAGTLRGTRQRRAVQPGRGAALGLGRGERLTPIEVGGNFHWVFATADGGLSTPAVYQECDRLRREQGAGTGWRTCRLPWPTRSCWPRWPTGTRTRSPGRWRTIFSRRRCRCGRGWPGHWRRERTRGPWRALCPGPGRRARSSRPTRTRR